MPSPTFGLTTGFVKPFIFSAAVGDPSSSSPTPSLQVYLEPTLAQHEILGLPPSHSNTTTSALTPIKRSNQIAAQSIRRGPRVVFASTPDDKATLTKDGSSLWSIEAPSLDDEVDDLIRQGRVADASRLVAAVGEEGFAPVRRLTN